MSFCQILLHNEQTFFCQLVVVHICFQMCYGWCAVHWYRWQYVETWLIHLKKNWQKSAHKRDRLQLLWNKNIIILELSHISLICGTKLFIDSIDQNEDFAFWSDIKIFFLLFIFSIFPTDCSAIWKIGFYP